jgi:Domain of unknown function (DUF1707)/Cell wall-active antibiotics response 4TMS YvqF
VSVVVEEPRDDRALRASDADRDRVAERLRQAAGDGRLSIVELRERLDALYAAKTYGELEPVVADLPDAGRVESALASKPTPGKVSARVGGTPVSRTAKAVFSGLARRGQWVVPTHYQVKTVFGGAELDLREARLESREVTIEVKAVFGGVDIIVPDDVIAVVDGTAVFGGFDDKVSTSQPAPGAPVVRIGGKAVFGGVSVHRRTGNSPGD